MNAVILRQLIKRDKKNLHLQDCRDDDMILIEPRLELGTFSVLD